APRCLGPAGTVRPAAPQAGGSRPPGGYKEVYPRFPLAGEPRPGGGDGRRRARPDPGHRRCRRGAAAAATGRRATRGHLRPGGPSGPAERRAARPRPGGLWLLNLRQGGDAMTAKRVPAADVVLLKHHLTALRLPTAKAECEQFARECASDNVDYLGFLL